MKNLRDYIAESAKTHAYVIKFAEKPTEEQVSIIETWLRKYDLIEISMPVLQEDDHIDFMDVPNRQTHCMHVSIGLPLSPYVMLQDIRNAANISEKLIIVRASEDPVNRYADYELWSRKEDSDATASGMMPSARLGTDREYFPAEQPADVELFGNEYNKNLLTYLAGVKDTRPNLKVDPPAPLFSWLQMEDIADGEPHQDTSDFNSHINTPKPVNSANATAKAPLDSGMTNSHDTMSDNTVRSVKFFKDPKTGKAIQKVYTGK